MLTIGVLSGTSIDAIDIALVDWSGTAARLIAHGEYPWNPLLQQQLLALPETAHLSLVQLGQLNSACGAAFAEAINQFIFDHQLDKTLISAIGSHGQTLWHQPHGEHAFSLQLGHPAIIAKQTGMTVAADFRMDDIALGGQGAPLAPAFHRHLLSDASQPVGVLNLGGIANLTLLDGQGSVLGFDTGPANTLLDAWYSRHHKQGFDHNGAWAASARVDTGLLERLLSHPYFELRAPKSTGREDFSLNWLTSKLDESLSPAVVQSTLLQLSVESIALAWEAYNNHSAAKLWLCGGGVFNTELVNRLTRRLPQCNIAATDSIGYPASVIEAMLFAWLAKERISATAIDLTAITGSKKPAVLGGLWLA